MTLQKHRLICFRGQSVDIDSAVGNELVLEVTEEPEESVLENLVVFFPIVVFLVKDLLPVLMSFLLSDRLFLSCFSSFLCAPNFIFLNDHLKLFTLRHWRLPRCSIFMLGSFGLRFLDLLEDRFEFGFLFGATILRVISVQLIQELFDFFLGLESLVDNFISEDNRSRYLNLI